MAELLLRHTCHHRLSVCDGCDTYGHTLQQSVELRRQSSSSDGVTVASLVCPKEYAMQPRLTRSASETMVAGVCGGLAEYFNIDPVIVRLIFVLITLTSGLGLPVYLVLWMIMPRSTAVPSPQEKTLPYLRDDSSVYGQASPAREREVLVGQRQDQSQGRSGPSYDPYAAPVSPEFRFDPITGEPLDPSRPATGRTVNLGTPPADLPIGAAPRRKRNWSTLGLILIVIGSLIFIEQLGIDMSLIFPVILIVAGVILMWRRR